jgi:hypothetical protein
MGPRLQKVTLPLFEQRYCVIGLRKNIFGQGYGIVAFYDRHVFAKEGAIYGTLTIVHKFCCLSSCLLLNELET